MTSSRKGLMCIGHDCKRDAGGLLLTPGFSMRNINERATEGATNVLPEREERSHYP